MYSSLNAYVNFISEALQPALEKTAIVQANASYAGTYTSSNSTMTIEVGGDTGLSVTSLTNNGTDVHAGIATLKGIKSGALLFRLYPTNL
jgi:hypothetical protein